jgi:hypothetical protein
MADIKPRTCYIMIKDIIGQEVGMEYGVDYNLEEGEELPKDVEDLTEAQYTAFKFIQMLRGTFEDEARAAMKAHAKDKPSGLVLPN